VNRIATGLAGLDLVLGGGLEPGSMVVVAGPPGTGNPRSLTITDRGIVVGDKLEGAAGRAGWSALGAQDSPDPARPVVPAPAEAP
jgi:hypothetical protein